ncbi:MAG: ATP-dependent RecD-like DNA helicase [Lentisphaerae bacterium]|nr:ATP-dependent RecD-like DNA helicase [Lentisphaerota bacterium]
MARPFHPRPFQPSRTPPPPGGAEAAEVSGTVESIVFRNDETGYTICSVRPAEGRGEPVTVVGTSAAIWVGEELTARGRWNQHPQFGRQFQADALTCIAPTSAEGLRRFLASGLIRGIGKVHAARIVAHFGTDTLQVIEKESARLEEVEGIGRVRRQRIKESWIEQRGIRDVMIFLQSHGVGTGQAARIFRQYGNDAIGVVKQNPYRLCEDVWGIGFKSADAIALRIGIPHDSPERARAGLLHLLQTQADEGHCFCTDADLLLQAQEMLGISVEILADALKAQVESGALVREEDRIYPRALHDAETRVAAKLKALLATPLGHSPIDAEKALAWAERKMGLTLADAQRQALRTALDDKVAIITGGPGVGKTTIIRALTEIFGARRLRLRLAAPTGRAAKRMSEATGQEAQTLHRLLRYLPAIHDFEHHAGNPLEADCLILDETSMIDIRLMDQFLQAVPDPARVVLVGDIDQLPSVGPGNVLRDAIASGAIPCRRLDTIFRQDASGLIVRNAHHINHGERLENGGPGSDFFLIETSDPEQVIARVCELVTHRIPRHFKFDPLADIQVLTPMRRNQLGADNLNAVLQQSLNGTGPALTRGNSRFRKGDRVMQLRNNYDKDVFNGDIGFVEAVNEEERRLVILFDGRPVTYDGNELDEIVHAYACTIHKSQGSEYPAVVIVLATQHFKLLQRNLLYTAVTRARKLVCIVGSSKAIHLAVRNNEVRERRTTLARRLTPPPPSREIPP